MEVFNDLVKDKANLVTLKRFPFSFGVTASNKAVLLQVNEDGRNITIQGSSGFSGSFVAKAMAYKFKTPQVDTHNQFPEKDRLYLDHKRDLFYDRRIMLNKIVNTSIL